MRLGVLRGVWVVIVVVNGVQVHSQGENSFWGLNLEEGKL